MSDSQEHSLLYGRLQAYVPAIAIERVVQRVLHASRFYEEGRRGTRLSMWVRREVDRAIEKEVLNALRNLDKGTWTPLGLSGLSIEAKDAIACTVSGNPLVAEQFDKLGLAALVLDCEFKPVGRGRHQRVRLKARNLVTNPIRERRGKGHALNEFELWYLATLAQIWREEIAAEPTSRHEDHTSALFERYLDDIVEVTGVNLPSASAKSAARLICRQLDDSPV